MLRVKGNGKPQTKPELHYANMMEPRFCHRHNIKITIYYGVKNLTYVYGIKSAPIKSFTTTQVNFYLQAFHYLAKTKGKSSSYVLTCRSKYIADITCLLRSNSQSPRKISCSQRSQYIQAKTSKDAKIRFTVNKNDETK